MPPRKRRGRSWYATSFNLGSVAPGDNLAPDDELSSGFGNGDLFSDFEGENPPLKTTPAWAAPRTPVNHLPLFATPMPTTSTYARPIDEKNEIPKKRGKKKTKKTKTDKSQYDHNRIHHNNHKHRRNAPPHHKTKKQTG